MSAILPLLQSAQTFLSSKIVFLANVILDKIVDVLWMMVSCIKKKYIDIPMSLVVIIYKTLKCLFHCNNSLVTYV